MSLHTATVSWSLRPGDDFLAGRYSRGHELAFDGGVRVAGSASPSNVPAPWSVEAAVDPEELVVAAISACHMLWFLDFARRAGVTVRSYRDAAEARLGPVPASGRRGLVACVLRPEVDADAPPEVLARLHHQAHEACDIANSVLTDVRVEPVTADMLQGA